MSRYIPIAVSRLMLSLRKAAVAGECWVTCSNPGNEFVRGTLAQFTEDDRATVRLDIESIRLKEVECYPTALTD